MASFVAPASTFSCPTCKSNEIKLEGLEGICGQCGFRAGQRVFWDYENQNSTKAPESEDHPRATSLPDKDDLVADSVARGVARAREIESVRIENCLPVGDYVDLAVDGGQGSFSAQQVLQIQADPKILVNPFGVIPGAHEKPMPPSVAATVEKMKRGYLPPIKEAVNHPAHYNAGRFEVIDVIEDWNLDFNAGNALKYIARAKHKGRELEDLKKAQWYINRAIEKLVKDNENQVAQADGQGL